MYAHATLNLTPLPLPCIYPQSNTCAHLHKERHTLLGKLLIHQAQLAQADPSVDLHAATKDQKLPSYHHWLLQWLRLLQWLGVEGGGDLLGGDRWSPPGGPPH